VLTPTSQPPWDGGTTDQLFTLSQITEGAWEFANPVYVFCGLGEGLVGAALGIWGR